MDASEKNWMITGRVLKPNLEESGNKMNRMFCLIFYKNYYKEIRNYPPINYIDETSRVVNNIRSNTWDEDPRYPWMSAEFDMHVDVTDLLSEKSIIPERS